MQVSLKPSRVLNMLFYFIDSFFIAVLVFAQISNYILIILILIFLSHFYFLQKQQSRWKSLEFHTSQPWKICDNLSKAYDVCVLPDTYCARFLIILNLVDQKNKNRISLVILPDTLLKPHYQALKRALFNLSD